MSLPARSQDFVTLWTIHSRQVYAYIFSLVANSADADDIFQETSVTLIEKFEEFVAGTNFSSWACRVAYFKTLSHLKNRRPFEHLDEVFLESIEPAVRQHAVESDARLAALSNCLAELSAKDRRLINTRYQKDLPVAEVARKVGRHPTGVYHSLARIHDLLLACIRRRLAEGERS